MNADELATYRAREAALRAELIGMGICPECGGEGEYPGPTPSHWEEPKYYKCIECRGSGKYTPEDDEPADECQTWWLSSRGWAL